MLSMAERDASDGSGRATSEARLAALLQLPTRFRADTSGEGVSTL